MKTTLKDCPSVHQVLLELNVNIQLHEDYIKHIINSELAKIRANIKKGKLLDFGCGAGGFLKFIKNISAIAHGIELENRLYPIFDKYKLCVYKSL